MQLRSNDVVVVGDGMSNGSGFKYRDGRGLASEFRKELMRHHMHVYMMTEFCTTKLSCIPPHAPVVWMKGAHGILHDTASGVTLHRDKSAGGNMVNNAR